MVYVKSLVGTIIFIVLFSLVADVLSSGPDSWMTNLFIVTFIAVVYIMFYNIFKRSE